MVSGSFASISLAPLRVSLRERRDNANRGAPRRLFPSTMSIYHVEQENGKCYFGMRATRVPGEIFDNNYYAFLLHRFVLSPVTPSNFTGIPFRKTSAIGLARRARVDFWSTASVTWGSHVNACYKFLDDWLNPVHNGYTRLYTVIHGYTRLYTVIHGYTRSAGSRASFLL